MPIHQLRNVLRFVAVGLSSGLMQIGCASTQPPAPSTQVRVAINPVPQSAMVLVAVDKGFFKQEGLDVRVSRFTTGKLAFDAVLGGAADVATVAEIPIMFAAMSGLEPAVLATIERSGRSVKVLARTDQGVKVPGDLRGKRVGTFKGSSAEYFLGRVLTKYGLSEKQVDVVHLQPPDLAAALVRGDLAAMAMWEPHIYNAKSLLAGRTVEFVEPDLYTETLNLAADRRFAESHKATVNAIMRALQKAAKYIATSPREAQQVVSQSLQLNEVTVGAIWPAFDFALGLDDTLAVQMRTEAEDAVRRGTIPPPSKYPDFERLLAREFLKSTRAK